MGVYQKTIGPLIAVPIRRLDPLFVFWLAALALLLIPGLDLPLRDWDEGIVARVAYERGQALLQWLSGQASFSEIWLPTYWDTPYLNKPPGLHLPSSLPCCRGCLPAPCHRPGPCGCCQHFAPVLWCRWPE